MRFQADYRESSFPVHIFTCTPSRSAVYCAIINSEANAINKLWMQTKRHNLQTQPKRKPVPFITTENQPSHTVSASPFSKRDQTATYQRHQVTNCLGVLIFTDLRRGDESIQISRMLLAATVLHFTTNRCHQKQTTQNVVGFNCTISQAPSQKVGFCV